MTVSIFLPGRPEKNGYFCDVSQHVLSEVVVDSYLISIIIHSNFFIFSDWLLV